MAECDECLEKMMAFYEIMHDPELKEWALWETVRPVKQKNCMESTSKKVESLAKTFYNWIRSVPPLWTLDMIVPSMEYALAPVPATNRHTGKRNKAHFDFADLRIRKGNKAQFDFVEFNTWLDFYFVEIYVQRSGKNEALLKIRVLNNKHLTQNILIILKQDNRSCPWARIQNDKYALFEKIPFGRFMLSLKMNAEVIGDYQFRIHSKGVKIYD
jgi:hypothetical protein